MPKDKLEPINLGSIARGALMELFERNIPLIAENINDKSTAPGKTRELTFTLKFKPDAERRAIDVTTAAKVKLVSIEDHHSRVYLGRDETGKAYLFDEDPRQEMLFQPPVKDENLLDFKSLAAGN